MKKKIWVIGIVTALTIVLISIGRKGEAGNSVPIVSTIAGQKATSGHRDGIGRESRFGLSAGITSDGTNLYVADTYNHTIRKIVVSTGEVTTLAGTAGVSGSTDAIGTAALFNHPQGITTDGSNLYVADSMNCTIRKIVISTGEVTTLAGLAGAFGSADGVGPAARFGAPYGITSDGVNLYIADTYNGTIRTVVISTAEVTTLAGTAGAGGAMDGTGTAARFDLITGITTDGANLYVIDNRGSVVRQIIIETSEVTTLAGTAGIEGSADGIGAAARFNSPQNIVTAGPHLYIADNANLTIRKIVISTGEVSTLAGAAGIPDSIDGISSFARFFSPYGITTDGASLYVTDMGSIRRIQ